jgi:glycosyltransferase involved in cell wall biosynthesis
MPKKKILWVVYDFVQAGGQRYVYEICKALNKEKYEIDFLKTAPLNYDKNWDSEFYYRPTLGMGCKIYLLDELLNPEKRSTKEKIKNKLKSVINTKPASKPETTLHKKLQDFFCHYDVVNFSGVAVYETTCIDNNLYPANAFIHILTFSFQHKEMYSKYDKQLKYRFISPVTPGAVKNDLRGFTNYSVTYFPLCFETHPFQVFQKKPTEPLKIAIFTRLSPMKPLDPFFYALKILLESGVNVKLEIYGAGDPEELGLLKQLKYLYISDFVKFKGHSESIPDTLKQDTPHLIWFQSANKEPGGYAAFEIAMSGLPQLFWDFLDTGEAREIAEVFPSFTNITSFVSFTKELLWSADLREELGNKQKEYTLKNYSMKNHIHILEEIYDNYSVINSD